VTPVSLSFNVAAGYQAGADVASRSDTRKRSALHSQATSKP
jgi:hypothetical protein